MKKILLTLVIILSFIILKGQDKEPTAWGFQWGTSNDYRPFYQDSFKLNSFLRGFQWSGTVKMNNSLYNNAYSGHGYGEVPVGCRTYPLLLNIQPTYMDRSGYNPGTWYAPLMNYEPTLELDSSNIGTFVTRPGDSSDPVFGFIFRRGDISNDQNNENYSRLVLHQNSNYSNGDSVLANMWPRPNFNTCSENGILGPGQTDNYTGKIWYLTINLRRNVLQDEDTIIDDEPVLSIKLNPQIKYYK